MYSRDVKALCWAPIPSKVSEMRRAGQVSDPLKSRCSRKCEAPASISVSSRLPVSTQHPMATERVDGMWWVMRRRPFGSVVSSCSIGCDDRNQATHQNPFGRIWQLWILSRRGLGFCGSPSPDSSHAWHQACAVSPPSRAGSVFLVGRRAALLPRGWH